MESSIEILENIVDCDDNSNIGDSYESDNNYESDDDILMYDYFQLDRAKESINFLVDEDEEDNDDVFSDIDDNTNNITDEEKEESEIREIPSEGAKKELTPCVIIDNINGVIQQCKSISSRRRLGQLVGSWEIDETAARKCEEAVHELGVCYDHFLYDQNSIHSSGVKQKVEIEKSLV